MRRLALIALLASTGCVGVNWEREHGFEKHPAEVYSLLEPGSAKLDECLERLGAPLLVWEEPRGAALAWGWFEGDQRGFRVSVPVTDSYSASFSGTDIDADMKGIVLIFDRDWTLRIVRNGRLRQLAAYGRQLPTYLDYDKDEPAPGE